MTEKTELINELYEIYEELETYSGKIEEEICKYDKDKDSEHVWNIHYYNQNEIQPAISRLNSVIFFL